MIGIDSMRNKKKELEFNPNPPLALCSKKFMVLYYKENGNVIWTSGGEYRSDFYDLLFESDDEDEVRSYYMNYSYEKLLK